MYVIALLHGNCQCLYSVSNTTLHSNLNLICKYIGYPTKLKDILEHTVSNITYFNDSIILHNYNTKTWQWHCMLLCHLSPSTCRDFEADRIEMERLEREKEEAEKEKARLQYAYIIAWVCPPFPLSWTNVGNFLKCKTNAELLTYYYTALTYCMD